MEDQMLINFCWFLGGAITYKILSLAFALGTALNIYNRTLNGCIVMLKKVDEQRLIAISQKHAKMKEDGVSDQELENEKTLDIENHYLWRETMINIILITCPNFLKPNIAFKDWESAMKLLNK